MPESVEFVIRAIFIGAGATAVLDLWSMFTARVGVVPPSNWGLVGRWIGYFPKGTFVHDSIAKAAPIDGERAIGWTAHYTIGIVYAVLLIVICGLPWARHPSVLPALLFAWAALVAPFFVMQPGMGAGIAASRTSNPNAARLRSVAGHTAFGLGLWGAATVLTFILP